MRKGSSGKDEKSNIFSTWIAENLERLKVPIFSPTIFKPLVLISALNCLQQCSGSLYIRKFIIQILDNNSDQEYSDSSNMTTAASDDCGDNCDTEDGGDSLNYFLPLIIFSVRLLVLFMMAFLIKKIRMRFLYFLSLFLTVTILSILGIVSDSSLMPDLGGNSVKYIKTCLLCLHVFFIQFGVQTLPGLLTDVLYPTSCAAVMKGVTRALSAIILIFFVFIFKNLNYSHAFYLMAAILFISSPFLYMFVPEIRNVGTEMSAEFFLPSQTVFYFVLPENLKRCPDKRKNALKHWKSAYRKVTVTNALIGDKLRYEMDVDVSARKFNKVKFDDAIRTISEVYDNEKYAKLNNDRINFVSNILGRGNYLANNEMEKRILIGRGPVKFINDVMKNGSLFLFNDVIILAKCVVSNRRYVGEMCFNLSEIKIAKLGRQMTVSDSSEKIMEIEFEDESISNIWEKYIDFWSKYSDTGSSDEDENISTTKFLIKNIISSNRPQEVPEQFV